MNKKVNGNKLIYQESQLLLNKSDQHKKNQSELM